MNRKAHEIIGACSGAIYGAATLVDKSEERDISLGDVLEMSVFAFAGACGGAFPDILEPALNPRHRNLFHSYLVLFLCALLFVLFSKKNSDEINIFLKKLAQAFLVGYASHLIVDSQTPAGLPFVIQ